ncbi:MAG: hypothetical protein ACR2GJ_07045 [Gemmatimonadaceae bacterium]
MRAFRLRAIALTAAAGLVVAGASACGDVAGVKATLDTLHDSLTVFPLTGSSPVTPTALNTPFGMVTPVGPSGNFDLAFDLDAQRRVIIYPVKLIVQPLTGVNQVGLLKVAGSFENLTRAPTSKYERDEALVVAVGEVVAIEALRNRSSDLCAFALSPNIYSKLVVDSVSAGTNAIWFRFVTNPNCGFRSFAPGRPKD